MSNKLKIFSSKITTEWFFSNTNPLLRLLTIYVNGDMLVLIPLLIVLGIISIFSLKIGMFLFGIYYIARGLGEMIYWLLHQFGAKTYRPPYDYGFKNLSNEAIHVIYQLTSMVNIIIGAAISIIAVIKI